MTERDERWEDVWAELRDMDEDIFRREGEEGRLRFRIEFSWNDHFWWVEQDVHKADLEADTAKDQIIQWIWNEMIKMMDQNIAQEGTPTYWAGSPPTTSPN